MNHHETTVSIYSDTTGAFLGKISLDVGYEFSPPMSATQTCPDDPAEVEIMNVTVKTINDGWIGTSSWI